WPIEINIDLQEETSLGSFGYLKRPGYEDKAYGINGTIGEYTVFVSKDEDEWTEVAAGEFTEADYNLHEEDGLFNVGDMVYANLDEAEDIRFVKIIQSFGALSDDVSFTGSELYFYEDTLKNTPQNAIDRANWNVTIQDTDGKEVDGSPLIDGDLDTIVDFYDGSDEWPYTILVDLGEVDEIASLGYQKRPGFEDENYGLNGT